MSFNTRNLYEAIQNRIRDVHCTPLAFVVAKLRNLSNNTFPNVVYATVQQVSVRQWFRF